MMDGFNVSKSWLCSMPRYISSKVYCLLCMMHNWIALPNHWIYLPKVDGIPVIV